MEQPRFQVSSKQALRGLALNLLSPHNRVISRGRALNQGRLAVSSRNVCSGCLLCAWPTHLPVGMLQPVAEESLAAHGNSNQRHDNLCD